MIGTSYTLQIHFSPFYAHSMVSHGPVENGQNSIRTRVLPMWTRGYTSLAYSPRIEHLALFDIHSFNVIRPFLARPPYCIINAVLKMQVVHGSSYSISTVYCTWMCPSALTATSRIRLLLRWLAISDVLRIITVCRLELQPWYNISNIKIRLLLKRVFRDVYGSHWVIDKI